MYVRHNEISTAIMCIVAGATAVIHTLKRYFKKMEVEGLGIIPIKSAPQGFVEVQGYAWPLTPLVNPTDGRSAVYFSFILEQHVSGGNSNQWKKIFEEKTTDNFFLADQSGILLLLIDGGECDLKQKIIPLKTLAPTAKNHFASYLAAKGINLGDGFGSSFFGEKYRIRESVVYTGSPLYGMGFFKTQNNVQQLPPAKGLEEFFRSIKTFEKAPLSISNQLHIANTSNTMGNSAEIYEELALRATQNFAKAVIGSEAFEASVAQETFNCRGVLTSNPETQHKLFFADCHQKELIIRLSYMQYFKIFGGAAIFTLGVVILLFKFRVI